MGAKAFEQCAGFLRIPDGQYPLDNTAVHPERYTLVEQMARDAGVSVEGLIRDKTLRQQIELDKYATEECGLPTLTDIMAELDKPGRDPRNKIEAFSFDPNVRDLKDIQEGMVLPGIVSNITNWCTSRNWQTAM